MNRLRLSLALVVLSSLAGTASAQYSYPGYPSYNNPAAPAYGAFLPYGMPVNWSPAPPNTMVVTGAFVATPPPAANGFSIGPPPIEAQVEPPFIPCVWGNIQYMLFWAKKPPVSAPLATTGSFNDAVPGAIGQPNTVVGAGGDVEYGTMSAARVEVGMWLNYDRCIGIEGSVLRTENKTLGFNAASTQPTDPPIFIPFRNGTTGKEGANLIASPVGALTGSFSQVNTFQFGTADLNGVLNLSRSDCCETDFLLGVRYMKLEESLGVTTTSTNSNRTTTKFDDFFSRDEYYGGQFGGRVCFRSDRCYLNTTALIGLGEMTQTVDVAGLTGVNNATTGAAIGKSVIGGNFTRASNIRHEQRDELSIAPSFQIKGGINLSTNMTLFAAYDFMYWTQVGAPRRPGRPHAGAGSVSPVQPERLLGPGRLVRLRAEVLIGRWRRASQLADSEIRNRQAGRLPHRTTGDGHPRCVRRRFRHFGCFGSVGCGAWNIACRSMNPGKKFASDTASVTSGFETLRR